MRGDRGYRPGLDGVRALAVVAVLLYHGQVKAVSGGFLGVDVFFVLSGFLITSILLDEHQRTGGIGLLRFWAARARRLLPAAFVVIAVALAVTAIAHRQDLGRLRSDAIASVLYVNNWHQVFAHRSYFASFGRPSLLQHFWSLAVEEQFYVVWPLLLLLLSRLRRRYIAAVALAGAAGSALLMATMFDPHRDPSRVYYGTDTRAMPILVGIVLACGWPVMGRTRPVGAGARRMLDAGGLAGLAVLAVAMTSWTDYDPFVYRGGLAVVAVAAALLIASAAHPASRVASWLATPPLVWLGRRSYGIYLWHWPVMALSRPDLDVHLSPWLLVPAQVAVTLVLAEASYRWVEMPIRRGRLQVRVRSGLARLDMRRRVAVVSLAGAAGALVVGGIAALPVAARLPMLRATSSAEANVPAAALRPASRPRPRHPHVAADRVVPRRPVLAVGASVMLAAIDDLHHRLHARVDAVVARQPDAILNRLRAYRAHHALSPVTVVQIGENGPLTSADLRSLRHVLAGVPRVILINLRDPGKSWIDSANHELAHLVASWPQATLADWHRASDNPRLLWDGTHPDPAGAAVYTQTIVRAIDRSSTRPVRR